MLGQKKVPSPEGTKTKHYLQICLFLAGLSEKQIIGTKPEAKHIPYISS